MSTLAHWALRRDQLELCGVLPALWWLKVEPERIHRYLDEVAYEDADEALALALKMAPSWAKPLASEAPGPRRLAILRQVADQADADVQAHAVVALFLERWGTSEDVPRLQAMRVDAASHLEELKARLTGSVGAVSVVEAGGHLSVVDEPPIPHARRPRETEG